MTHIELLPEVNIRIALELQHACLVQQRRVRRLRGHLRGLR